MSGASLRVRRYSDDITLPTNGGAMGGVVVDFANVKRRIWCCLALWCCASAAAQTNSPSAANPQVVTSQYGGIYSLGPRPGDPGSAVPPPQPPRWKPKPMHCPSGRPVQTGISPPGAVHLEPPTGELTLGKPFTMHLTRTRELPERVFVTQFASSPMDSAMKIVSDGDGLTQITTEKNGVGSFSLIPIRTGRIQIRVVGLLPCEGMFKEAVTVTVKDPVERPFKFLLSRDLAAGHFVWLNLHTPEAYMLSAGMQLGPSSKPLRVDPHSIRYKVTSDRSSQVISFDPSTGWIRPVGVGEALIEASYNGAKAYACAVVIQRDAVVGFDRNRCRDLVPEGVLKQ
jgi:hypothetical protein